MRERRAQRGDQRLTGRGYADGDATDPLAPRRGDGGLLAVDPGRRRRGAEVRTDRRARERDDDTHGARRVRRERDGIAECGRRVAGFVAKLAPARLPVPGGEPWRERTG